MEVTICGLVTPVVTATVLLDGLRIGFDIPPATFDLPTMPRFTGRSEWKDGMLVTDTVSVVGIVLDDPNAPWPARRAIVPFDHDADGKPGITAFLKQGDGFGLPPADVGFTQFADQVYIASRVTVRLTAANAGCNERLEGSVEPLGFDYTVVGRHAKDRGDCNAKRSELVRQQRPSADTWNARQVDLGARVRDRDVRRDPSRIVG